MSGDPVIEAMNAMAAEKAEAAARADLSAEGLVKVYGDRTVVNGMNVHCSCGEIVGILGPNGAGKTTTFYMIVGLVRPEEGRVMCTGDLQFSKALTPMVTVPSGTVYSLPDEAQG